MQIWSPEWVDSDSSSTYKFFYRLNLHLEYSGGEWKGTIGYEIVFKKYIVGATKEQARQILKRELYTIAIQRMSEATKNLANRLSQFQS